MVYSKKKILFGKSKKKQRKSQKNQKSKKVKVIIAEKQYSDEYMKQKEGEYFDEKHYNLIVKENCDCYYFDENNERKCLFKFRKNVIPDKLCNTGIECLKEASKKT